MDRKSIYRLVLFTISVICTIGICTSVNNAQGEGAAIRSIDEPAEASGGGTPASARYSPPAKRSGKVKTHSEDLAHTCRAGLCKTKTLGRFCHRR